MPPSRRDSEDISCSLSSRPQKHVRRIQEQNRLDHHSSCITYAVVQPSSSPPSSVSSDSMPERQRLAASNEELHLLSSSPSSSHTTNQHISSFIQKALFSSPPSSTALFDPSLGMMPLISCSWGYQLPSFPSSHTTCHQVHSISQALKPLFSSPPSSSRPSSHMAAASPLKQPSPSYSAEEKTPPSLPSSLNTTTHHCLSSSRTGVAPSFDASADFSFLSKIRGR